MISESNENSSSLFPQWPLSEPSGPPPARVDWVTKSSLCFVGGWEPLSFRKRAGYAWTDEDDAYAAEFSDDALDRYLQLGATGITIPYSKGFGHCATHQELEHERDITARGHAKGMRIGAYIRVDAIVPETVRSEYPDVDQWLVRSYDNQRSVYNNQQKWRRRVCYSHPQAVRRLENIFRYAVEVLQVDLLHLDGFHIASGRISDACRCDLCLSQYRQWLRQRYPTPESLEATFGILNIDEVEMPFFERNEPFPSAIYSPDIRAWARFQWERYLAFTRHLRRFVRSLSSDVAICINPSAGVYFNSSLLALEDAQAVFSWVDMVFMEDSFHLRFAENGVISRSAAFKLVREAGLPLAHYHFMKQSQRMEASLALSIAANGGHTSCMGFSFRYLPSVFLGQKVKTQYNDWVRHHWDVLGNTHPAGEIALVRHQPSMAWNGHHPWQAVFAMEALLNQELCVPWRMFNRIDHPGLKDVRTLLLPDAECLSLADLDHLRAWVEGGGNLFFTTRTARYDEERRRRPRHPILDWTDAWRPINNAVTPETWFIWAYEDGGELANHDSHASSDWPQEPVITNLGEGRLGWWPTLRYKSTFEAHRLCPQDLQPPLDAEELQQFISDLHGPFTLSLKGPPQLLFEVNTPAQKPGRLIHIIRVDESDESIAVDVHLDNPLTADQVACISPDERPPHVEVDSDTIRIRALHRYAVLHLFK